MSAADRRRSRSARAVRARSGSARSTSARCASRAACSTTTRPATLPSPRAAEVEQMLEGFLPPVPHDGARRRRQRPRAALIVGSELGADELDEVAGILARTPAQRDRRALRHRARAAFAPWRPAPSSSARSASGCTSRSRSCAAASARAPRSSSPNSSKRPSCEKRGRQARALDLASSPRAGLHVPSSAGLRSRSTIRPAASRASSRPSARTRSSATTASWCAPIRSCTSLSA